MRYTRYSRRYTRYTCDIHGDIRDICDITAISPIYARCTRYTARCTRYTARCTRYTRYPARYTRYARYTPIYTISRAIYAIYTRYKTEKLKSACAGPCIVDDRYCVLFLSVSSIIYLRHVHVFITKLPPSP